MNEDTRPVKCTYFNSIDCICRLLRFFLRIFESTFCFYFYLSRFLESYFYFLLKYFVLQNYFTFTQVVLRAITFTQVLKKVTRLNMKNKTATECWNILRGELDSAIELCSYEKERETV